MLFISILLQQKIYRPVKVYHTAVFIHFVSQYLTYARLPYQLFNGPFGQKRPVLCSSTNRTQKLHIRRSQMNS